MENTYIIRLKVHYKDGSYGKFKTTVRRCQSKDHAIEKMKFQLMQNPHYSWHDIKSCEEEFVDTFLNMIQP